jgi:hypothetical protein
MEQTINVKNEEMQGTNVSPESVNPKVNGLTEKDGMLLHPEGGAYANPDHPSNPPGEYVPLPDNGVPHFTVPPGGHMEGTEPPIEAAETTDTIKATEATAPVETIEVPAPIVDILTADEQIISDWLKNGKVEVTTNELKGAGFEVDAMDPHVVEIGRFKLSRLLLVSPYKIEKIVK